jgi:DNA-binding PadR family transcriptional regulator
MGHAGEFEMLVLLAVLRLGTGAYGVTVRDELENETSRTLTLGTIYKTLGRLETKGHLRSRTSEPTAERGGRRKKLYEVSSSGLVAVRQSLGDLRRLADGVNLELEER